jgi:hypothetical protein
MNQDIFSCVEKQDINLVKKFLQNNKNFNSDEFFYAAVNYGDVDILNLIIKDTRFNVEEKSYNYIHLASSINNPEMVNLLLKDKRFDPTIDNNHAFKQAYMNGYIEIRDILFYNKKVQELLIKNDMDIYPALKKDYMNKKLSCF